MEFEHDAVITDEQRILAATKVVVIEPININIVIDDAIEPPTIKETHANVDRDTENTATATTLVQPSQSALSAIQPVVHHHFGPALIIASLVAGIIGGATLFIVFG